MTGQMDGRGWTDQPVDRDGWTDGQEGFNSSILNILHLHKAYQ